MSKFDKFRLKLAHSMEIEGLRETEAALDALKPAGSKAVGRKVLIASGEPLKTAMAANAPVDEFDLRDSIAIGTKLTKRQKKVNKNAWSGDKPDVEVFVGVNAIDIDRDNHHASEYAHIIEFGGDNRPAQPFARPAWDTTKMAVLRLIINGFKGEIMIAVQKARIKAARMLAKAQATKR